MHYSFADCVLDTVLYTLQRAGTPIPLRPKVFQVLRYLLEHRDQVISKDELCA
jgi:DNA-binding winged helix-turn-helix (wHTH) protein